MARKGAASQTPSSDESGVSYRASLSLLAFFVACLTALVLVTLQFSSLSPLLHSLKDGATAPSSAQIRQFAPLLGVPLLAALVAYICGRRLIQLVRIETYRRRLHSYLAQWLLHTYAPLSPYGVTPTITRARMSNGSQTASSVRLADLIVERQQALLAGREASGKTVALYALAYELTRKRALFKLWTGQAPLPVLIALDPTIDPVSGSAEPPLTLIREALRQNGTAGLAARAPALLRRGRLALLCDGLDDAPHRQRLRLLREYAQLANKGRRTAVIMTCSIGNEDAAADTAEDIGGWQCLSVAPLSNPQIADSIRKARRERKAVDDRPPEWLTLSLASPATLAALLGAKPPAAAQRPGRADLWRQYAEHAPSDTSESSIIPYDAIRLLGALAAGLRASAQHAVPVAPTASLGRTLAEWLDQADPPMPTEAPEMLPPLLFGPEALQTVAQRALSAGVLRQDQAKSQLRFANRMLEAAFAARWLDAGDDGLSPLRPELLQSEWILPVLLWAGAAEHPGDVTARLLRLLNATESASVRAGYASHEEFQAAVLALALGTACESWAPILARELLGPNPSSDVMALAEEQLRDLIDHVFRRLDDPDQQNAMRTALATVVEAGGHEVIAYLRYLITNSRMQRLVRAQLIVMLGLITAHDAIAVAISLLDDPDALTQQAVAQALALAGVSALPLLREALGHPAQRVRARAAELLAQLGDTAIDTAIAGLTGQQPEERVAAARTLGILHATRGEYALSDRLAHDAADVVRVAAALALGQIATEQAVEALQREATAASPAIRAAIAQALGAAHDARSLGTLLKLLTDSQPRVRAAAAAALGLLGDEHAVPALREHRDDQDPWTQNAIVFALRRLGS